MTRKSDADRLAEWLERASLKACQNGYGQPYPDVTAVVADHVVVATLDPGKEYNAPDLDIYPPEQVAQWVRAVRGYRRANPGCSLVEALEETRP
jgi:hypothetical protein